MSEKKKKYNTVDTDKVVSRVTHEQTRQRFDSCQHFTPASEAVMERELGFQPDKDGEEDGTEIHNK